MALLFITNKPKNTEASIIKTDEKIAQKVKFSDVKKIINQRCIACHSAKPTDNVKKIKDRVVVLKNMPFTNKTKITQEERDTIGKWIDEGSNLE